VEEIIPGIRVLDVEHLGLRRVIGVCLVEGRGGHLLIDPGPRSTWPTLQRKLAQLGVAPRDLVAVLLTHIHLDHAGATGELVALNPVLRVLVHERGAGHVRDPSRLVRSARRLWGDELDRLWGEPRPVPEGNLEVLSGGEGLVVAGRRFEVAATPGHASHHVCYLEVETGTVFAGDTAGVRVEGTPLVTPPTPPPDGDLEAWERSLEALLAWQPERVVMTHFGAVDDVVEHVAQLRARLREWGERVRGALATGVTDEEAWGVFAGEVAAEVRAALAPEAAEALLQASPPELSWQGLARYWRSR
jgi:glyoxylase-like metal-dependent hydrolase (beta-lactamase superfamily II)